VPELAEIYGEFARIEQAERDAASGITLLALANRLPPPAMLAPAPGTDPETGGSISSPADEAPKAEPIKEAPETPFRETMKTPGPEPEPEAKEPPRRDTARPEEHTDFPL
jgi:hypothetical protein